MEERCVHATSVQFFVPKEIQDLPPWVDPVNNRTEAKQVTNKLSEVTEFLAGTFKTRFAKQVVILPKLSREKNYVLFYMRK